MLKAIMDFHHRTQSALQAGIPLEKVTALPIIAEIARMKEFQVDTAEVSIKSLMDRVRFSFAEWGVN
jgi:vacuolar-type H+-ATPase catalytic subunit A/Vma1